MNILILFGASSTLGQSIIKLNKFYDEVIIFDRQTRYKGVSPYDTILLGDLETLFEMEPENHYKIVYLAAQKFKLEDLESDLNLNVKIPLNIFGKIKKYGNVDFCYIGSQGDIHGSPENSLYNSSKRYVSQYLEAKIFDEETKCIISIFKPWIFHSKMYSTRSFFRIMPDTLAELILTRKHQSKIYLVPKFTYFLVTLLYTCTPKFFFYKLINFLKR